MVIIYQWVVGGLVSWWGGGKQVPTYSNLIYSNLIYHMPTYHGLGTELNLPTTQMTKTLYMAYTGGGRGIHRPMCMENVENCFHVHLLVPNVGSGSLNILQRWRCRVPGIIA